MTLTRREMLIRGAALGLAPLCRPGWASANFPAATASLPLIVLVQDAADASGSDALAALGLPAQPARIRRIAAGAVLDLPAIEAELAAPGGSRLLSRLDACNHCLILEAVRGRGGAVLHEGRHRRAHLLAAALYPPDATPRPNLMR